MDIIRRILQGYFGYSVNFVQNVTDIDDKVSLAINRAHTKLSSVHVRTISGRNISNRIQRLKMLKRKSGNPGAPMLENLYRLKHSISMI